MIPIRSEVHYTYDFRKSIKARHIEDTDVGNMKMETKGFELFHDSVVCGTGVDPFHSSMRKLKIQWKCSSFVSQILLQ